jgi:hypothetical protein
MDQDLQHPTAWHAADSPAGPAPLANFAAGRSLYLADVREYDAYRALLYALGAKSVSNRKLAHVDTIVYAAGPPKDARTRYPNGAFVQARSVLPLFHQEVDSFSGFVRALQRHGFTVRNPSDEGDPDFDHFDLPLTGTLPATLLQYLVDSPFTRAFAKQQHGHRGARDDAYVAIEVPGATAPWYYRWVINAWSRVYAQRGEGDYPLEIKGLVDVAPAMWTRSTGLYFHDEPHIDSVNGLFIQAGISARTGRVEGVAISRVWT